MTDQKLRVGDVFTSFADNVAAINAALPLGEHPEVDPESGLEVCTVCGEPRQMWAKRPSGEPFKARCKCRCERDKEESAEAEKRRVELKKRQEKAFGGKSKRLDFTFERDDGKNAEISRELIEYCENFPELKKEGLGLFLFSPTNGGGKTFFACAVANRLIERGYYVRVTDIMTLRDEMFAADKNAFLSDLCRFDLIVIDDLGTECGGAYTAEAEYRIINKLTDSGVPLVLTSNYTPKELAEHSDRDKKRIYDRVLGVSLPFRVDPPNGQSRRITRCKEIYERYSTGSKQGEAR